jgi:hypothetical protein
MRTSKSARAASSELTSVPDTESEQAAIAGDPGLRARVDGCRWALTSPRAARRPEVGRTGSCCPHRPAARLRHGPARVELPDCCPLVVGSLPVLRIHRGREGCDNGRNTLGLRIVTPCCLLKGGEGRATISSASARGRARRARGCGGWTACACPVDCSGQRSPASPRSRPHSARSRPAARGRGDGSGAQARPAARGATRSSEAEPWAEPL